jgi:SAM-dependent methyltransferase
VCDGGARIVTTQQPGYQRPNLFSILQCDSCGTAHALPLETSAAVYDLIYSQASILPGYDRYARYAGEIRRAGDPLAYLGAQEDVYWAVWRYFCEREAAAIGPVLEIGCGLGYLTYAMRQRGLDATGIDLSPEAIARARARYGPFYEAADAVTLAQTAAGRFGLVVMTEVIEHLPDFYTVMRAIAALLRNGGEAVITTPNRSAYAAGLVWETDPPPVHLWWFTEDAMREMARRLGMRMRFADFGPLNEQFAPLLPGPESAGLTRAAMFDEAGKILVPSGPIRRFVPVGRIYGALAKARARWTALKRKVLKQPDPHAGRRGTLCAIFTKGGEAPG